ncbi:zinc dependent phospholipase C family protein [Candidatus Falkowbacteria bacterium]|nr:zinc dependent phospholipase C family protein [Candidatus Falkowbacteria bacterium]
MPKENTHLYFANELLKKINQEQIFGIIQKNIEAYYFGSVAPDTFYYSSKASIRKISETMHGRSGNMTNEIVFEMLKAAREKKSETDLAFIFGYLTHCSLDITFHPIIYYLSGNYYDPDPKKSNEAVYLHRHLETYLDVQVNSSFYFNDLISYQILRSLSFSQYISTTFNISFKEIENTLKRKAKVHRLLRNNFILDLLYIFYRIVKRSSWAKFKIFLGIFYGNLTRDNRIIPKVINYRDVVTGEEKVTTIYDLFSQAGTLAVEYIATANAYYHHQIRQVEAKEIIRGESLNTGHVGTPASELRYFYDSKYEHPLPSLPRSGATPAK